MPASLDNTDGKAQSTIGAKRNGAAAAPVHSALHCTSPART